ncbi:rCG63189 [Rattus norvegicus]|uniref:RCG63189 n=1 Tax=Rattus norvegicus TaxID=10116 RepID=A6JYS7_RAT|nr:rCG63189 [Rattus norvegicus]
MFPVSVNSTARGSRVLFLWALSVSLMSPRFFWTRACSRIPSIIRIITFRMYSNHVTIALFLLYPSPVLLRAHTCTHVHTCLLSVVWNMSRRELAGLCCDCRFNF